MQSYTPATALTPNSTPPIPGIIQRAETPEFHQTSARKTRPSWFLVKGWLLTFLLCFFALSSGRASFQATEDNSAVSGAMGSLTQGDRASAVAQQLVVFALVLYFVLPKWRQIFSATRKYPILAAISIFPLLSATWSQQPRTTIREGLAFLLSMAFAIYFAKTLPLSEQFQLLFMTAAVMTISSIFISVAYPQYGIDFRTNRGSTEWEGIFAGKNVCAMSLFFLLMPVLDMPARNIMRRLAKFALILAMLFLITMTRSKTGMVMTALYFLYFPAISTLRTMRDKRSITLFLAAGSVVLVSLFALADFYSGVIFQALDRNATLSGRTEIWEALWESLLKRPLLGYGYRAFWLGLQGESAFVVLKLGRIFGYAHNGFLGVAIELGFIGVGLFFIAAATGLSNAFHWLSRGGSKYMRWCLGVILFTLLYNFDEGSLIARYNLPWLLFVAAWIHLREPAVDDSMPSDSPTVSRASPQPYSALSY